MDKSQILRLMTQSGCGGTLTPALQRFVAATEAAERERWAAIFARKAAAIPPDDEPLHRGYKLALSDMVAEMRYSASSKEQP